MKTVSLESVTMEGFKSFADKTTIDLTGDPGIILFAGENRVEPRLGANGAGKSAILNAIHFCFYGTAINGDKISDLITYGKNKVFVGTTLWVDDDLHTVERSGPPAWLYIDGKRVEQIELERLIGRTREQFLHSVIYGQGEPLFVDLPIPKRGELLDDVLDLQHYMRAADLAGKKYNATSQELSSLKIEIGRTEGALASLEAGTDLKADVSNWETEQAKKIDRAVLIINELHLELEDLRLKASEMEKWKLPDAKEDEESYNTARERVSSIKSKIAVIQHEIQQFTNDLTFFVTNSTCPTCKQTITRDLSEKHVCEYEGLIAGKNLLLKTLSTRLESTQASVDIKYRKWKETTAKANDAVNNLRQAKDVVKNKEREHQEAKLRLLAFKDEKNPHVAGLERQKQQRKDLREKLRGQKQAERDLNTKLAQLEFWKQGFKRVRLFCIGKVMPQLELETMNAASSLGLVGWKIDYMTETETKSGTAKTGVQIEVSSSIRPGKFSTWSGGEGQRVRLCCTLGFAGLIQRWSGVKWDLEAFDESTNFLSDTGVEDLIELLKIRSDQQGKRIIMADHRGLQNSGVDRVITIVKDKHGSFIQ